MIVDLTDALRDSRQSPMTPYSEQQLAVHRCWRDDWPLDEPHTVEELMRGFRDDPALAPYTGGQIPYHWAVGLDGTWYQLLKMSDGSDAHVRRWNRKALGVAVIGDPRQRPPSGVQLESLHELLAELCQASGIGPMARRMVGGRPVPYLAGHSELPGASSDPNKECPGEHLPMGSLRRNVAQVVKWRAQARLGAVV